jgi:hypothetical protein
VVDAAARMAATLQSCSSEVNIFAANLAFVVADQMLT